MSTGATDMAQLRAKGIQAYGIGPAATDEDRAQYGAHSDVERLLEASLYKFVEFVWNAVVERIHDPAVSEARQGLRRIATHEPILIS